MTQVTPAHNFQKARDKQACEHRDGLERTQSCGYDILRRRRLSLKARMHCRRIRFSG